MPDKKSATGGELSLDRLMAFSDGVIAIAITILVLGIDIPADHSFSDQGLFKFLARIRHDVIVYAASFWIIGAFWVQHHAVFAYFRYCDRWLLWLNTLFLFSTTLIPFLAKLKSIYKLEPKVVLLFGAGFVLTGLSLLAIWRYAVARSELHQFAPIDPAVVRSMTRRILLTPVVSAAAVGLSFINVHLGTYAFLTLPLFYLSHRTVDSRIKTPDGPSA
ncbi:hypothetical protein D1AOALGA4SA_10312 [Olavius algarvensis Delta 1 endosymbiont]|nr:hypothetical protein D1AOALGA4SA_10312 [Olavius algarvensis Delta 1 endosymbiont]